MLTLRPRPRGREQAACWQLLRFAAGLTRPDGTSARVPRQPSPVETTHPHRTERRFGMDIVPPSPHLAKTPRPYVIRPGRDGRRSTSAPEGLHDRSARARTASYLVTGRDGPTGDETKGNHRHAHHRIPPITPSRPGRRPHRRLAGRLLGGCGERAEPGAEYAGPGQ